MKIYLTRASDSFNHTSSVGIYSNIKKAKDALRKLTDITDVKWIVEQNLDPIDINDNYKVVWSANANEVF